MTDIGEQIRMFPSERTLLPDEISPILAIVAWLMGVSVSLWTANALPFAPKALVAAIYSPALTLFAYVLIHMMTGRRWIVECDSNDS